MGVGDAGVEAGVAADAVCLKPLCGALALASALLGTLGSADPRFLTEKSSRGKRAGRCLSSSCKDGSDDESRIFSSEDKFLWSS